MICLIEIYFRVVSYSETLLLIKENPEGKNPISSDKNILNLIDIILMIIGATISLISLLLNIIGLASSINYLKKEKTDTDLKNTYYIKSLLLLFENCLVTICWIYFVIYWGIYIYKFFTETKETPKEDIKKEDIKEKKNDENPNSGGNNQPVGSEPPPPLANSRNIANASSSQRTSVDQQIITQE
jgi:predicted membrane protein